MHPAPGAFDDPLAMVISEHIYTEDASDYYAIPGILPAEAPVPGRLDCACLCGKVRFSMPGPAGDITACHCRECRKLSGHHAAFFPADEASVDWQDRSGLAQYESPGGVTHGFCTGCGSSLYRRGAGGSFAVEAGVVTPPTGGHMVRHVFMAQSAGYDAPQDDLPCFSGAI